MRCTHFITLFGTEGNNFREALENALNIKFSPLEEYDLTEQLPTFLKSLGNDLAPRLGPDC